jgi:HK97 family phage major capsid protein
MSLIDRSGATALIPEDYSREIVQGLVAQSIVLGMLSKLPNMTRKQQRMPVLSLLPTAYFVNGDTGRKGLTNQAWANKYIEAEEVACIVPIPEAVLDDADYDLWEQIRPRLIEAIGAVVDGAVLFGANAPAAWPMAILRACQKAGNVVILGTGSDIADDIGGENGVMAQVEDSGFDVNGIAAALSLKAKLRGLRDSQGQFILQNPAAAEKPYGIWGVPAMFSRNGAWDSSQAAIGQTPGETGGAHMIAGDFRAGVYSVRQDITFKLLTEATLYDTDMQTVLYALAQQDMVALRVVIRLGWQVPNPINRLKPSEHDGQAGTAAGDYRYPFSALVPPALT